MARSEPAEGIIFYDGVCALCNRFVRFVLRRDRSGRFRFAPLQGATAGQVLPQVGQSPGSLDTVVLVRGPETGQPLVWRESSAVVEILRALPFPWPLAASVVRAVPRRLRDAAYRWVAGSRYRVFGRFEHCPLPPPHLRSRFPDTILRSPADNG